MNKICGKSWIHLWICLIFFCFVSVHHSDWLAGTENKYTRLVFNIILREADRISHSGVQSASEIAFKYKHNLKISSNKFYLFSKGQLISELLYNMYFLQKVDIMLHFTLNGIFRYHWLSIFTFLFTFLFTWKVLQDINLDLLGKCYGV